MKKTVLLIIVFLLPVILYSQEAKGWNMEYSDVLNSTKGTKCLDEYNNPCIMSHLTIDTTVGTVIYYFKDNKLIQVSRMVYDNNSFKSLLDFQFDFQNDRCGLDVYVVSFKNNIYRIDILPSHILSNLILKEYKPAI